MSFCGMAYNDLLPHAKQDIHDKQLIRDIRSFTVVQGSGEPWNPHNKRWICNIWCENFTANKGCQGMPQSEQVIRGVNYGGRFVPEFFLALPGNTELFTNLTDPPKIFGEAEEQLSLCDVGHQADNATERMKAFLNENIRKEHFDKMSDLGFNVVRLPLGYWNLINLPGSATPNGVAPDRWRGLQDIMLAKDYKKWIDKVFDFAGENGLRILLDLHGAPGAQAGNAFTGCDIGKGHEHFDTAWNKHLAVHAVEMMAESCKRFGSVCYGIELLNEPSKESKKLRKFLKVYYQEAIKAARKHLDKEVPLIINEWTWFLPWWKKQPRFSYSEYGRVMFSTHLYNGMDMDVQEDVRNDFAKDFKIIEEFFLKTKYEFLITEYSLSGHGNGDPSSDSFDYHSLANWLVHQLGYRTLGSFVWNFDANPNSSRIWGPVANAEVGKREVKWREIFQLDAQRIAKDENVMNLEEEVSLRGQGWLGEGPVPSGARAALRATAICAAAWALVSLAYVSRAFRRRLRDRRQAHLRLLVSEESE